MRFVLLGLFSVVFLFLLSSGDLHATTVKECNTFTDCAKLGNSGTCNKDTFKCADQGDVDGKRVIYCSCQQEARVDTGGQAGGLNTDGLTYGGAVKPSSPVLGLGTLYQVGDEQYSCANQIDGRLQCSPLTSQIKKLDLQNPPTDGNDRAAFNEILSIRALKIEGTDNTYEGRRKHMSGTPTVEGTPNLQQK